MFISSMWVLKNPHTIRKRVGHEVPGVVAVLCACMGGYREVTYLARDRVLFVHHLAILCKSWTCALVFYTTPITAWNRNKHPASIYLAAKQLSFCVFALTMDNFVLKVKLKKICKLNTLTY